MLFGGIIAFRSPYFWLSQLALKLTNSSVQIFFSKALTAIQKYDITSLKCVGYVSNQPTGSKYNVLTIHKCDKSTTPGVNHRDNMTTKLLICAYIAVVTMATTGQKPGNHGDMTKILNAMQVKIVSILIHLSTLETAHG